MGRTRPPGFTLIELVMTLALLAVGVPALIAVGNQCLTSMHQGAYATTATSLAQQKLEMILADKAANSRGFAFITAANYPAETSIAGFPGFARSVTISPDSTDGTVTFRNISVTATAPDGTSSTLFAWVVNQ